MFEIITDQKLIKKYNRQFINQIKAVCDQNVKCIVGNKGSSSHVTALYSTKYEFWIAPYESENRYWNAFGLHKPKETGSNSIVVEINFPFEGRNRRIGGVFGEDENGNVYVLHSGKIGGGRPGIGKDLFRREYWKSKPIIVADEDKTENELYLIAALNSSVVSQQISDFIIDVNRIKSFSEEEIEESKQFSYFENFNFTDESTGVSKIRRGETIVINRTHGFVVNHLKEILEKMGYKIAKNKNIDLFIHYKGKIKTIIEVKRSSSSQYLYAGVGQLLIYSMAVKNKLDLILVLPDLLKKMIENRLEKLGIQVLYYDYNGGFPTFYKLENIFKTKSEQ